MRIAIGEIEGEFFADVDTIRFFERAGFRIISP